jgi:ABC-type sugar transport system ATPase subunit
MVDISKEFPGVKALDKVSFELRRGEVHALVGENGAGKSTLMKILGGIYHPDSGRIILNGREVQIHSPGAAQSLGIAMIHQELNLVPYLSVAKNMFLGREPVVWQSLGVVHWKKLYERAIELLGELGLDISPLAQVDSLGIAQRQMVEVAKALSLNASIIVMDEPTATLTNEEVDSLFKLILRLKARGVSVIYISHRLEEVKAISDRVTVLRDGKTISTAANGVELSIDSIIRLMVGRDLGDRFPRRAYKATEELLCVEGLSSKGVLDDISIVVRSGEIVGVAGLVGSGRTELARAIFGADPKDDGKVYVRGHEVRIQSPLDAVKAGIGFLPEDRQAQGLILSMSVSDNITITVISELLKNGLIDRDAQQDIVNEYSSLLGIKAPSPAHLTRTLSGGNQQKVVLAKWLCAQSEILIFDEPTRGIDVGAKIEVYRIMSQLAEAGRGIIMISSELPEILAMSDRIVVMHEGRIAKEFSRREATQEKIMACATGG